MKILVIEDDQQIVTAISFAFQTGWPSVKIISAEWGQEGIDLAKKESPDLIILDLGLPDINGLDVIKQIRLFSKIPIIVLTVVVDETIVVQALGLGANEYIYKPFRQMELVARVKSLLSWHKSSDSDERLRFGKCLVDSGRREIIFNKKVTGLTCTENEILRTLIKNSPDVVSYEVLAKAVWGDYYDGAANSLKVHISNLRKKIEINTGESLIILSKTGSGYYIIKPEIND